MGKNNGNGLENDAQVHENISVFDIEEIVLEFFLGFRDTPGVLESYLRPAGEAGGDNMPQPIVGNFFF